MFKRDSKQTPQSAQTRPDGFAYLDDSHIYMDTACQSLRPQPVIDALESYYTTYNACGGRVKYAWGKRVDELIEQTRTDVLNYLSLQKKNYSVSFTLNTTYGLNLLLTQLPSKQYARVVTSDIEHNSVFLPTIEAAKRLGMERVLLERAADGSLTYSPSDLERAIVVLNAASNIDGRTLKNIRDVIKDTHARGGIVIIDAAQTMAHYADILRGIEADAICFSAHKLYAASLGVIVIRHDLLKQLRIGFVGGGMVTDVREDSFDLFYEEPSAILEPGLQAFGEIISLHTALDWLSSQEKGKHNRQTRIHELSNYLYDNLTAIDGLNLLNTEASSVVSVYSETYDAHRLAVFLSSAGVMVRSGYFCCHYFLKHKKQLPPLLRFSIGLHTTTQDIDKATDTLRSLLGKGNS